MLPTAGTLTINSNSISISDGSARSAEEAHQRQLSSTVFVLDKMKRIYRPMSLLVRREQEENFLG